MWMLDEAKASSFSLEYLGFEVDWEYGFSNDATSPLYVQNHSGVAVLHFSGHAETGAPVCEVRIPVKGLERYCENLFAKSTKSEKLEVVDPRYEGRKSDMSIMDPSV